MTLRARERLLHAMVETAARYGHAGASVEKVIVHAGASRATFYEEFADRDDCFTAAYRQLVAQLWPQLDRCADLPPGSDRLAEAVATLVTAVEGHPAHARFLLIESLAGPAAVRREHEQLLAHIAEELDSWLAERAARGESCRVPGQALLGGVVGVLSLRLFIGDSGRLEGLTDELCTWIDCYFAPDAVIGGEELWARLGATLRSSPPPSSGAVESQPLPRGRSALPPDDVAVDQKRRIVMAVARECRRRGYAAMRVADIVAEAGVTRRAFYRSFANKEEAFLAAQIHGLQESMARSASEFFGGDAWPERVWRGLTALCDYVGSQPDLVYVDLVESYAAGHTALRATFDNLMAYTIFLEEGGRIDEGASQLPQICSQAIAGAIHDLMRGQVSAGRSTAMLEIAPLAAYMTLTPYIGAEEALRLVRRYCQRASEGLS